MKKFTNVSSAIDWLNGVFDNGTKNAIPAVAEQVYKDSNDCTYRDTGDMSKSGELHSDFENGVIVERTPYVRRRYYEGGKAGAGNPKAQPRWFEKTMDKYGDDYKKMIINQVNIEKKR